MAEAHSDTDEQVVEDGLDKSTRAYTPREASKNPKIRERAFEFACRVVRLHYTLSKKNGTAKPLLTQLLNSGTSIGANLEEAEAGQSRADFIAKSRIALKEARESLYWLRLLSGSGIVPHSRIASLAEEANEIVAILTTIVRKSSSRS